MKLKICTKCNCEKPQSEFRIKRIGRDGLPRFRNDCRPCEWISRSEDARERKRERDKKRCSRSDVKKKNSESCLNWRNKRAIQLYGSVSLKGIGIGKACFFMVRKCRCCGDISALRRKPSNLTLDMCNRCRVKGSRSVKSAICPDCGAFHASAHSDAKCKGCAAKYVRAAKKKRKAIERGAMIGELVDAHKVFAIDGWRCRMCNCKVQKRDIYAHNAAELDHIMPLSKGGLHTYDNIQTLCRRCNAKKSDTIMPTQLRMSLA